MIVQPDYYDPAHLAFTGWPIIVSKFLSNTANFEYEELIFIYPCSSVWVKRSKPFPVHEIYMIDDKYILVNQTAMDTIRRELPEVRR